MAYNPEKLRSGIEHDDLFERLDEELERARRYFEERVDVQLARERGIFDRALVDVLVYRSGGIRSRIW